LKNPIAGKEKAMPLAEGEPESRGGERVQQPEGLQPKGPLTGYIFFSKERVPIIMRGGIVSWT